MLKKLAVVVTISAAAVTALGGIAVATQHGDDQVQACVRPGSMELRLAAEDGTCRSGEQPLSWSAVGPQGLPGPQGMPGVTSVRVARGESREVDAGSVATFVYGCPDGGWATSADPTISSPDLVIMSMSPSQPPGARQVVVMNRGTAPASVQLDLVCAQVPYGVLQPGHDGASVQQYEAGLPIGDYTPATSTPGTTKPPTMPDNGPVPTGNSDAVTWGQQGDRPLVDETGREFAIAATATGLVPDADVVVKGWYVALDGHVGHVGHTSVTGADGQTGVGHSGPCGFYKELVYSFTQGDTTVVGRTAPPC